MNPKKRLLGPEQQAALVRAINLGMALQDDIPEIADAYRAGTFYDDLLMRFHLCTRYRVTDTVAKKGIHFALHGFPGGFASLDPYSGLLSPSEREAVTRFHYRLAAHKAGTAAAQRGVGIHALTDDELRVAQQKGNATQREKRLGIYGLSLEERQKNGALGAAQAKALGKGSVYGVPKEERIERLLRAVPASIEARGLVPWTPEETAQAYALWINPDYRRTHPPKPGRPDLERIAAMINTLYHQGQPVRNKTAVDVAVRKYRKKEGKF